VHAKAARRQRSSSGAAAGGLDWRRAGCAVGGRELGLLVGAAGRQQSWTGRLRAELLSRARWWGSRAEGDGVVDLGRLGRL
jgi:hypothetical protein